MGPLGLHPLLKELGLGPLLSATAIGSIIGRMARPGSGRATRHWLSERSALGKLLDTDFAPMGSMRLTRAADALMAHRETIEWHLFDRAADLFELRPTTTLYDLTHTYFEGGASRQPKAWRRHSKEQCSDCNCPAWARACVSGRINSSPRTSAASARVFANSHYARFCS